MRLRVTAASACWVVLTGPLSAASVPLADLLVDARVEKPARIVMVDWENLGHRAAGWEYEADSGRAWGHGPRSQLELDRVPNRAMLVLTGRPFLHRGCRVQAVEVMVNDQVVGRLRMVPWERSYRIRIPDRALTEERIFLSFQYRWTERPTDVLKGSDDSRRLAVSWSSIQLRTLAPPTGTSLEAEGEELVLRGAERIRIPFKATPPVSFTVDEIADGGIRVSLDGAGNADRGSWRHGPVRLQLPPGTEPGTSHVRLTLRAEHHAWWRRLFSFRPPEVRIRGARIEAGEVRWPSRELGRMGFFPAAVGPETKPNLIVLWIVDTLRADHLGLYGYQRDTSPRLDAFATEAVTFDRAVAQSAWTRPSVTSILTGQLLKRHGVYGKEDALAREATTLAELLSEGGFDTAAFITNGNLGHVGLEQGFGHFHHLKEGNIREFHHPAPEVTDAALRWLDRRRRTPAFLYLHVTDPHMPYAPLPDFADVWPVDDRSLTTIDGFRATISSPEPTTQKLIDLYDAEIRQADAAFGVLLEGLRERDLYGRAMIVFAADHGEEFLDHGSWQHGNTLYAEQIATPLVVRWPEGSSPYQPGSRVGAVASHADLAPTVMRAAGLIPPTAMQGRDLAGRESRSTLAELRGTHRASVDERYKLITDLQGTPLGLFDVRSDRQDRADLSLSHPEVLEYHRRLHALFLEKSGGGPGAESAEQDPETIEQLRALGYLN